MIMSIRKLSFKVTMVLFLVSAALMLSTCMVYAGDTCQLIKIQGKISDGGSNVQIFPEKVTVPVGTCTVWINFVPYAGVRIIFRENIKECLLSTAAATGFQESELETGLVCNITGTLVRGQTASLVWSKPGIYKYTVENSSPRGKDYVGKINVEGIIEVK